MSKTHWKQLVNLDYIGAYALDGNDLDVTIQHAKREIVIGASGKKEECLVAHLVDQKPLIVNRTNAKALSKLYGPYVEDWAGKRITLYPTTTKFGGEVVECLRIRPEAPKQTGPAQIKCEVCGSAVRAAGRMTPDQIGALARSKYGKTMCVACGKAEADRIAKAAEAAEQDKQAEQDGQAEQDSQADETGEVKQDEADA